MGYKIEVYNGLVLMGYLKRGKIKATPTYYPHPSSGKKAAEAFAKRTGLKYKIVPWATASTTTAL